MIQITEAEFKELVVMNFLTGSPLYTDGWLVSIKDAIGDSYPRWVAVKHEEREAMFPAHPDICHLLFEHDRGYVRLISRNYKHHPGMVLYKEGIHPNFKNKEVKVNHVRYLETITKMMAESALSKSMEGDTHAVKVRASFIDQDPQCMLRLSLSFEEGDVKTRFTEEFTEENYCIDSVSFIQNSVEDWKQRLEGINE